MVSWKRLSFLQSIGFFSIIPRSEKERKLWWKVSYVKDGSGSLSATIRTDQADGDQQEQPLTTSSTVNAYFIAENGLFSSLDLELATPDYRVSLLKKKIISGTYLCLRTACLVLVTSEASTYFISVALSNTLPSRCR